MVNLWRLGLGSDEELQPSFHREDGGVGLRLLRRGARFAGRLRLETYLRASVRNSPPARGAAGSGHCAVSTLDWAGNGLRGMS